MSIKYLNLDEFLRYEDVPEQLREILDQEVAKIAVLEKENKRLERNNELAWEQVGFARDLIETLQNQLQSAKSGKHAREIFKSCLDNGYFEL